MTYDFNTTDPWHDPQNPWPIYNSVYLQYSYDMGATDTILLTASEYNVYEGSNSIELIYRHPDGYSLLYSCEDYGMGEDESAAWKVYSDEGNPLYAYIPEPVGRLPRSLPIKVQNDNTQWYSTQMSLSGLSSLVITPNYNDRVIWQTRRLRHLGYI